MRYLPYITKGFKLFYKKNIMPEYVTFFVTNECNARCEHCFYWKELNSPMKKLDLDEIEKISQTMGNFLFLLLTGGEPFLRDDLADIARIFHKNSNVRKINIVTNGNLPDKICCITEEMLKECPGLYVTLFVSIDDIGDKHDKIRGVNGIYENVLRTINNLKKIQNMYSRLSVGAAMVYSSSNENTIEVIYDHIKNTIKPDIINCAFIRGDVKNRLLRSCDVNSFVKIQKIIKNDLIHNQLKGTSDPIIGKIISACKFESISQLTKIIKEDRYLFPCYAGKINVVIYPNGDIFPCELLNNKIGNLREAKYDFKKLWFSKEAARIREDIKQTKCYCTHECYLLPNVMFNPRFLISIIKNFLSLVAKM